MLCWLLTLTTILFHYLLRLEIAPHFSKFFSCSAGSSPSPQSSSIISSVSKSHHTFRNSSHALLAPHPHHNPLPLSPPSRNRTTLFEILLMLCWLLTLTTILFHYLLRLEIAPHFS